MSDSVGDTADVIGDFEEKNADEFVNAAQDTFTLVTDWADGAVEKIVNFTEGTKNAVIAMDAVPVDIIPNPEPEDGINSKDGIPSEDGIDSAGEAVDTIAIFIMSFIFTLLL